MRTAIPLLAIALVCTTAAAQATKSDADLKAEFDKAQGYEQKQDFINALPLYEDLHKQQPSSLVYDEHLAMALLGSIGAQPADQRPAITQRAKDLLLTAQKAGDNSNLVQILLEKLSLPAAPPAPPAVGHEFFEQAEAAFSKGDLEGAVKLYDQALAVNPNYYAAATFAGDTEYKLNHPAEAGKYFAQAIAINPDIETAHRYWGDCLDKAGDHQLAEQQFIQAIIAEPYQRSPRVALKQWADHNHATVVGPPITLPKRAEPDANGHTNLTLDPNSLNNPTGSLWLTYQMAPTIWHASLFAKTYPNEKTYRHSLAEEAQALRLVLVTAKKNKVDISKDTTLTLLTELDKNGFLEAWILLDHPDQGIAQDYVAYRKDHRDTLAKYIAQYDVHKN